MIITSINIVLFPTIAIRRVRLEVAKKIAFVASSSTSGAFTRRRTEQAMFSPRDLSRCTFLLFQTLRKFYSRSDAIPLCVGYTIVLYLWCRCINRQVDLRTIDHHQFPGNTAVYAPTTGHQL